MGLFFMLRMSFETLGSREGFHGLCLPGLRLDDGRYDTKPLTKEEQDLKEKKDKESGAYFVTGEGDNPYSTLNDVRRFNSSVLGAVII